MAPKKKTPRRLPATSLITSSSGGDISASGRTRPTRTAGGVAAGALRSAVQKKSSKKSPSKKGKSAAAPPSAKKRVRSPSPANADGDDVADEDDDDEEDDDEDDEADAAPPSTPTPSPRRRPRARLLEAHFLPCQRCLRSLGRDPDLECPGPGDEPCPRCKGLKKSAAECCPVSSPFAYVFPQVLTFARFPRSSSTRLPRPWNWWRPVLPVGRMPSRHWTWRCVVGLILVRLSPQPVWVVLLLPRRRRVIRPPL